MASAPTDVRSAERHHVALFSRSSAVVAGISLTATLGLASITGLGIASLNSAADDAQAVSSNEVATATLAAEFALAVDRAFVTGRTLALVEPTFALEHELFQEDIPKVEELLVDVRRIHADDATERATGAALVDGWTAIRAILTNPLLLGRNNGFLVAQLLQEYQTFNGASTALVVDKAADAEGRDHARSHAVVAARWRLVGAAAAALALLTLLSLAGNRRIRREIEPIREQAEFADSLQLTGSEDDAHLLLQRRLLRVIPQGTASILNRNNSADRLESKTDVSSDPDLAERLHQAQPRACIAIRSAQAHDEDPRHPGLITCDICAPCPVFSSCTPMTVGGEVIGSVLVNTRRRTNDMERQLVRGSVSQAAPVLANLRNLAIAELRASTDALTGLPNKRSVGDALKRMFAQASRTATPMAVVFLDLDHFKDLNDQFGHPVGDQVLAGVGAAMRSTLRDSDFAGRNGGEEFAVILPNTDTVGGFETAEKLREAIARVTVTGLDLNLTASLGVATYPEHALSPERLERLADAALYVAKRSGRNRVEIAEATPELPEELQSQAPVAVIRNGAPSAVELRSSPPSVLVGPHRPMSDARETRS
jgi:diguanylate cyclase (GGDEF)-like protein